VPVVYEDGWAPGPVWTNHTAVIVLVLVLLIAVQAVGCGYMDWIGLAQDRDRWRTFVSAVMILQVP